MLLSFVGATMVVLSAFFVLHLYNTQVKDRSRSRAESFTEVLAYAAKQAKSPTDLEAIVRALAATSRIELVAVADSGGTIVATSQQDWRGLGIRRLLERRPLDVLASTPDGLVDGANPDGRYSDFARQIALPFSKAPGIAFIRLKTSASVSAQRAAAWSLLVWLTAGVIISVLTISLVMQRILVAPIEALRVFADQRGASRLLTPLGPPDEVSIVAEALSDAFFATSQGEALLADLAETDGLTGLGNRSHFKAKLDREIAKATRRGGMVGVMVLNLDKFKDINDTLGHSSGDLILQRTAEILKICQRKGDTVARLGADEFGVILANIETPEDSVEFANRFIRAVGAPFRVGAHELHQTACVGLTIFPQDGRDGEVLLKNADLALSRAKQEGSGASVLYRHELHLRAMERNSIERDLRTALAQKQLVLFYQPKVDIHTGRISGAEALIRWRHPERGLIPPDLFIPVAEQCGFITEVTQWVLGEACRQNRAWQQAGLTKIGVAVNVSAVDLRRPDLSDIVAGTLIAHSLSPQYLDLEVTESMVMRDVDVVIGTLRRLRSLGVGIGIDDFGTGYSSLAYLKRFPVKQLKIDRSFVRDIADTRDGQIIPKVIVDLAHALGVSVLAEGVEDANQLEILRSLGCDEAQGYFLGKPMEADEFEAFLRRAADGMHPDATVREIMAVAPSKAKVVPKRPVRMPGSAA
ncbi:MAG: EAL domain-containing protein [Parvibaculum sp.]|uniref:putative bifunctional diguanylate cyclase/phosphodiesterase n=1 Tax=Parvibaculum sp. TaxID=2024848 RepID=UPI00284C35B5|nr:EAL domain-containing protein [Parvibaculum sp.]MDR3499340.1 EAL domain-containing protein [Parvibaculum sp.]